ncbi:hypothetical protein [Sphingomonas sp. TDK1]|uniref:hypothetical protein n=1 Tax=Sphingomonas sp. TDK1 TaxID=453247 RepID=UPI0007D8F744|nr:hypothetical protein [Sphingomonas sp. TDK1]OAN66268.1 hypothetical protein A7X12_12845 [Sphingomonas sp. TDK1]
MGSGLPRCAVRDSIHAVGLALLLGAAWTARDHAGLAALRLPDADDGLRLQQVRDWLGGQGFADLTQYRLGPPPGLPMHWSRIADLAPAAMILLGTPILGSYAATIVAVTAVPILWFAVALMLVAGIARRLAVPPGAALLVAALAYPATTIFAPGRIDHHGLQLVLVLALLRAALAAGTMGAGAAAGAASAISLGIGLETAPILAVGGLGIAVRWVREGRAGQARMAGYAMALLIGLGVERALFATRGWDYPACDGFTATLWRAAMLGALAPAMMAGGGVVLEDPRGRLVVLLASGGTAVCAALLVSPACLSPYGAVDPVLARVWLAKVAEAQTITAASWAQGIAFGGVAFAGLAAAAWQAWRSRTTAWTILLAFQLVAVLILLVQLRGAYVAAMLGAPALAAMVSAARGRGPLLLGATWLGSAGIVYGMAGEAPAERAVPAATDCTAPAALARVAALPPGLVVAPIDFSADLLPVSRHRVLAGPYHRNTQGNRAMLDLFQSPPVQAEAVARRWGVDYVALCPDGLGELGAAGSDLNRLAGALRAGQVPGWLAPVSKPGEVPNVYRLVGRGSAH